MSITRPLYKATRNGNVEFTEEEYAEAEAEAEEKAITYPLYVAEQERHTRNSLLAKSDYTQIPDNPLSNKEEWATYRAALRDVPAQAGFPDTITWPTEPGG